MTTTSNIVPFRRPEPEVPHLEGTAVCLDCKHIWQAVAPLGTEWMECPACTLVRGRFKFHTERGSATWSCKCGNDLFHVAPEFVYCPNCGRDQEFP